MRSNKTAVTVVDKHERAGNGSVLSLAANWLTSWDIVPVPLWRKQNSIQSAVNAVRRELGQSDLIVSDHSQSHSFEMVASDNPSLVIGKAYRASYRPVTNREFLGMLGRALEGTKHELVTIGTCGNRARRFAAFKIVGLDDYTAGGRQFGQYLRAFDYLDQSGTLGWSFGQMCYTCTNQFNKIYNESQNRAKHTRGIVVKMAGFSDIIEQAIGVAAEFQQAFDKLAQQPIARTDARAAFAGFIGNGAVALSPRARNVVDELDHLFVAGRGNLGQNRADLFSAVTDYYTHSNVGGSRIGRDIRQFESSEFGSGNARKQLFFEAVQSDDALGDMVATGHRALSASVS